MAFHEKQLGSESEEWHPHKDASWRLFSLFAGLISPRTLLLGLVLWPVTLVAQSPVPAPSIAPEPMASSSESVVSPSASSETSPVTPVPRVSLAVHGWNGGLTISGVHDSVTGWAVLSTPAVGYSFNDIFTLDATVPIYSYRLAESLATNPKPNQQLITQRAELGDVVLSLHAQFVPSWFEYQVTGALSVPSGDETYGLTTGRVTFDIDNHFERSFGRLTPTISIGGGDSTSLVNRLVTKNYTSLGPLAHFQAGLGLELFHGIGLESDAYEQLPIGDQKIYGPSRKGKPTIVIGHNVSEDNGFTNALDVPLDRHTTLSAYYSRSLRVHTDTVAIGLTYVLRAAPAAEEENAVDDLFR